jgi:flavin reductase (DIM6/NTAB) family NADH-FMN oxidoreductase RutF
MHIAASSLDAEATYKLVTGLVVPRPIAWVTTLAPGGIVNLAPFSAFTFVSNSPPMVGINVGRKAGVLKDTGTNIHATGEFVVNIADESMLAAVHESAVEHAPDVSEVELLGLATAPCLAIATPRLADVPASLECRFHRAVAFGNSGSEFIVGEVLHFHLREGLVENGKVDTRRLKPICRIAGPNYATLGEIVTLRNLPRTSKNTTGREG